MDDAFIIHIDRLRKLIFFLKNDLDFKILFDDLNSLMEILYFLEKLETHE